MNLFPTPCLQPEDKQVFSKVAGLLTWVIGLLALLVLVISLTWPVVEG